MVQPISLPLVQGATGTNPTADAFYARTQQLDQKRQQEQSEQDRRDNEMLQVFKMAGDGYTNEARYLAQQKGLQVPDDVFKNSDFAKGLALSGEHYGNDPAAAQKFAMAWSQAPGDYLTKYQAARQAAGDPIRADDREFETFKRKELWKKQQGIGDAGSSGFSLSPGETRYDAAGNPIASGAPKPPDIKTIMGSDFTEQLVQVNPDGTYTPLQQAQPQQMPAPPMQTPIPARGVYAVQQLMLKGYSRDQIIQGLVQRGASPAQAQSLADQAGAQ